MASRVHPRVPSDGSPALQRWAFPCPAREADWGHFHQRSGTGLECREISNQLRPLVLPALERGRVPKRLRASPGVTARITETLAPCRVVGNHSVDETVPDRGQLNYTGKEPVA